MTAAKLGKRPLGHRPKTMTAAKRDALILDVAARVALSIFEDQTCLLCSSPIAYGAPHADDCPFRGVSDADIRSLAGE